MRSSPVLSPPRKGWADIALGGSVGGLRRPRLGSKGFVRHAMVSSRVPGMLNGADCGGILCGGGRSFLGAGNERRGASRRGSTCFRYVVKMSGRSRGF